MLNCLKMRECLQDVCFQKLDFLQNALLLSKWEGLHEDVPNSTRVSNFSL
jgi:hypothetical protein